MAGGTLSLNAFFQTNPPFSRDNRPTNVNKRENALPNSFLFKLAVLRQQTLQLRFIQLLVINFKIRHRIREI